MKHLQINLNVLIHKISVLLDGHPQGLYVCLNTENEQIAFGSQVPLRVGEAYLEISASNRFSLFFDPVRNAFSEKKIIVCIYLITSSGRIPAGTASINTSILKKGTNKINLNIDKCPDKNAFIETTITYQVLNEIQFVQSSEHIADMPPEQEIFTHRKKNSEKIGKSQKLNIEQNNVSSPKGSQDSDIKKSIDRISQLHRSKAGRQIASQQLEIEQSNFARRKAEEKSERQIVAFSPGNNDYTSKIKLAELEKQLKGVQKRYEQSAMDLKAVNSKKDMLERGLKEAQGQLKIYKEKYEDSQQSLQSLQKRFEFKQSSLKQQIKNLTQKLGASQNEKQQLIFEKNDIVTEFQEREKTLRLSIRQKEKQLTEQRNRLVKKNEQIVKQLADMQAKTGQYELKLVQLTRETTGLTKQNQLLEDKCQGLLAQLDQLKQVHLNQKSKRQELEETLGNNLELEDEKKKFKKKINEQEQEINKHLKNIAALDSNYQRQIKKTEQVELNLKEKTNLLKNLQRDFDNLGKDAETLKKTLEEKQKKIEQLGTSKQGQSSKVENLTQQLRQLEKKSAQQIKGLKKQIKDKETRIQGLCKESEDQVQAINDYNSRIQGLEIELQGQKSNLARLNEEHLALLKTKSELEEEIIQLEVNLSTEKGNKEQVERTLKKEITDRQSSFKQLQQKIKKFQNSSANKEEQDAYRISLLEQKIINFENEAKENLKHIDKLKEDIKSLEQAKLLGTTNIEELQFTIKIKNNEIVFLKQTVQKNNQEITELSCQNKELAINLQKMTDQKLELQIEIESLNHRLDQAHQNGSGVQQELAKYIKNNSQKVISFLNVFLSGEKIQFLPIHQQAEIQALMGAVINRVNQIYIRYENDIKKLLGELEAERAESNQLRVEVEGRLQQNEDLRNSLDEELARNHENNEQSNTYIKDLKKQLEEVENQLSNLQSEFSSLKEVNKSLSEELDTLNSELENKSDENVTLKQQIEQLGNQVRQQEREFSMTQSRQSSKFEEEATSLKSIIASLQDQSKIENNKTADLNTKLNQKTKQYKQLERKTTEQIKRLNNQNEKLNGQLAKQAKQIEAKGNLNNRYSEIETELRGKLEQANKDNAALKELNETIRKRNQRAALKQKELEDTITNLKSGQSQLNSKQSDLQRTLKERTAEFVASREQNFKLEKEKQKLIQDLEINNALIKVKEDTQKKLETSIKNLETEKLTLKDKIKSLESSSTDYEKKTIREISSLTQAKNKCEKLLQDTKLKLQAAQSEILGLSKNSQEANKQYGEQIKQLKLKNKDLEDKVALAAKNLADQEKTHSVEDLYLKSVKDNMQLLKGHMAEYTRVGDQFESNKNKLLKLATTKADIPTDKYIGERMRDVSFAYNKLKVFILGCELNEVAKNQAGEEIKSVQIALDRVLRGQK